jgi:hypothetical protein
VNYWHAWKCADITHSAEQTDELVADLNRHLLESESRVIRNEQVFGKLIYTMEMNLLALENAKLVQEKTGTQAVETGTNRNVIVDVMEAERSKGRSVARPTTNRKQKEVDRQARLSS